ncbi:MAG: LamB/YcsF family protein [Candidatus Rokubacteria bacterium]|nr:LamB/YcsF family protein [Candidatus Rokubacteria bacterium]
MAAGNFIDLNCDMGESYGRWTLGADAEIMPLITSANVACGYHGGDPHVMRQTVELALNHRVAIGAHPGLPDLMGFGRRAMDVTPEQVRDYICYQTGALREFVRVAGSELQHVKPHGILYNMMEKSNELATAAGQAVRDSGSTTLILMTAASSDFDATCRKMGTRVASEGFADRAYTVDGHLASRKLPGSLITDPKKAAAQAVKMANEGRVVTLDGVEIDIAVQTICCHGDTPGAPNIVRAVREGLEKAGWQVRPLRDWLPMP